jgi:hypothetical protein
MKVRDKGFAETNILVANENEVGVAQFRGWFAGLSLRPKKPNSMQVERMRRFCPIDFAGFAFA